MTTRSSTSFFSMIAFFFALVAILIAGTGDSARSSIRAIAMALLLTSVLAGVREFRVYQAAWRHLPDEKRQEGTGLVWQNFAFRPGADDVSP